jgi:2-polyprenyl-3-methyl-5-hydroxy-6-metoxy-1,4-benzoquinol methylase
LKLAAQLHENIPPNWYYWAVTKDQNIIRRYVHLSRFKEVRKVVEKTKGKILDIGCADGVFTKEILDASGAKKIIGIDVLKKSVDWANKHWHKEKKIEFKVGDAHKINFKANEFDAVFALEVLEHVFEPVSVLQEIRRVLKKDGYAVFLVPAETLLFKIIWFFWTKYTKSRIWKETHVHAYSSDFLVKLVKAVGFKVEIDNKIIFGTLQLIKARNIK